MLSSNANQRAREPNWQHQDRFGSVTLPAALRYWLLDDDSLTAHLIRLSGGEFRVRRLSQQWQVPRPSEQRLLELPQRELALIREVELHCYQQPVVFARSVFPLRSLSGSLGHLRKLQSKPLGAILFKNPHMTRSPFELAKLSGDSSYLPAHLRQEQAAWGRRSRFAIDNKPLMVSEVFLQNFSPWPRSLPIHRSKRGTVNAAFISSKQ